MEVHFEMYLSNESVAMLTIGLVVLLCWAIWRHATKK